MLYFEYDDDDSSDGDQSIILEQLEDEIQLNFSNEEIYYLQERNKLKRDVFTRYGRIAAKTFKKLNNNKFFNKYHQISIRKIFYCKIYLVYCKYLYQAQNKPSQTNLSNLKIFVKSFPSINYLSNFILELDFNLLNNKKEVLFLFYVIQILDHYYRKFDYPCYRFYKKFIDSVSLNFFKKVSDNHLLEFQEKFKMPVNLFTRDYSFLFFPTKEEYINFFTSKSENLLLLSNGLNKDSFISN